MFSILREYARSWWFKAILLSIVFSFLGTIFWIWGRGSSQAPSRLIADVNGEEISFSEYQEVYDNLHNFYSRIYRDNFTPELLEKLDLKRAALNQLIRKRLILSQAKELGIKVSDQELFDWIKQTPAFQRDGVFDYSRYLNTLSNQRVDSKKFEEEQREALLLKKLEDLIKDSVKVSDLELKEAYSREKEEVQVEYLLLKPDLFTDRIGLSEEEIKKYYNKAKESFRRPTTIRVEYVLFSPKDYLEEVKVSDKEIKDFYKENEAEYWVPKRLKARHILLKLPSELKPEEEAKAKKLAQDLIERIKKGEDFAELAKKHSQDPASASQGGDLGYFQSGEMIAPFEEAAFSLKRGEISPPVRTPFGYHIIKLEDIQEARTLPLAQVRQGIQEKIATEKARRLARIKAGQFLQDIAKDRIRFSQLAGKYHLTPKTTDFFSRDQTIPGVVNSAEFVQMAFSSEADKISSPLRSDEGYYLLKVVARKESYILPLDEVKEKVKETLLKGKARGEAAKQLKKIEEEARKGVTLEQLAAPLGLVVERTDFFPRNKDLASIPSDPPFIKAAFALARQGDVNGIDTPEGLYLLRLLGRKEVKEGGYKNEEETFKKEYLQLKSTKFFSAWLERLYQQAKIQISQEML